MKTKVFKTVLPVFAMLLGVGLAFSTEPTTSLNIGYIQGPSGPVEVQVDCKSETDKTCFFLNQPVYADKDFKIQMRKSLP